MAAEQARSQLAYLRPYLKKGSWRGCWDGPPLKAKWPADLALPSRSRTLKERTDLQKSSADLRPVLH